MLPLFVQVGPNISSRTVWIPPGGWQDAWSGAILTGPSTINVSQPYERIPMWHRRDGGLMVMAPSGGQRVSDHQRPGTVLTIEAFPAEYPTVGAGAGESAGAGAGAGAGASASGACGKYTYPDDELEAPALLAVGL